jgi:hypothetical protein
MHTTDESSLDAPYGSPRCLYNKVIYRGGFVSPSMLSKCLAPYGTSQLDSTMHGEDKSNHNVQYT